ncbi:MAG: ABC transporter substrate-binding protein [Acidimicrobiales bacterium]|nr:ABC transporter substrate-binding protein [Acidimicrobiales bacterium]
MRRHRRALAVCVTAALAAAACGGDDGGGGGSGAETGQTVDEGVKAGVAEALGGASTTAAGGEGSATTAAPAKARPASMEEWEELWAEERAAILERIKENGWGTSADGTKATGPEGFTIDLTKCASGWSNTEGLTDTEIKIGQAIALSGAAADYGNIARSMDALFGYYNEQGFFKDSEGKTRNIQLNFKDDGYDAARTIPLVDELIDSEKVFAVWTLGSPNGLAVYDKLNARCIPHPLEMSGHPAWGDPVNHPWTTGQQMAYNTEAVLWGAFIDKNFDELVAVDGTVTVTALVANSDFGKAYEGALEAYFEESPNKDKIEFITEVVEFQAPTVTDPMTTLASKNPEVFITMTGGAQCPQIITEAAGNGMKDSAKYLFMSSVCKAASFVGKDKVGGDGSASNGWWIIGGGALDFNADANSNDAFVKWGRELLTAAGHDYKTSGNFGNGFLFGFPFVQAMKIAGDMDGGLTRSNFIVALRTLDMTAPGLLEGIRYNMNGNADAYLTEGSDISQYDSAKQTWIQQGPIVELSGKSKPCAFDRAANACG